MRIRVRIKRRVNLNDPVREGGVWNNRGERRVVMVVGIITMVAGVKTHILHLVAVRDVVMGTEQEEEAEGVADTIVVIMEVEDPIIIVEVVVGVTMILRVVEDVIMMTSMLGTGTTFEDL